MSESLNIAIFEWLAAFLVLAAAAALVLKFHVRSRAFRGAVLWLCAITPLIRHSGLFVYQYSLTIAGHISVTSMVLLAAYIIGEITGKTSWKLGERRLILAGVAVGSVLVLPAAFGLVRYDGYQLGYRSVLFALVLLALAVAAAVTRRGLTFVTLVAAAAAFELHLLASNNFWDYLIDPSLTIFAITFLIWNGVRWLLDSRSPNQRAAESR